MFSFGEILFLLLPTLVSVVVLVAILVLFVARRPDTAELNRLTQRVRDLETNHVADFAQIQQLHDKLLHLGRIVSLFADYVLDLHNQLEDQGMEPVRPLPDAAREWMRAQRSPSFTALPDSEMVAQVTHILDRFFDESELRMLAQELNVDYENLRGETRRARALSLAQICNRFGRLQELIDLVRKHRPNISWALS